MQKTQSKISEDDAADYAWLMRVFSLIPDSVYGRVKNNKAETKSEVSVTKGTTKSIKKKSSKNKKHGKKLPDMPEKNGRAAAATTR